MKKFLLYSSLLFTHFASQAQENLLKYDIYPGAGSSFPKALTVYGDKLYFYAYDSAAGQDVHFIDDKGNAPQMLANINPDDSKWHVITDKNAMMVVNNQLYFWGRDGVHYGIFEYDGNGAPALKRDLLPLHHGFEAASQMTMTNNGRIVFVGTYNYGASQVWTYDPVANKALKVTNLQNSFNFIPDVTSFNGKVYFSSLSSGPAALFVYDLNTGITRKYEELHPGDTLQSVGGFTQIDNKLYFYATTPLGVSGFYSFDGVSHTCISCNSGLNIVYAGNSVSQKNNIIRYGKHIYYTVFNINSQSQLVRYDPATGKSDVVHTNQTISEPIRSMCVYNNKLYFCGSDNTAGTELWAYDGTKAQLVADINPGVGNGAPDEMVVFGNSMYFTAYSDADIEVYKYTTETPAAVQLVMFAADVKLYPNPAHDATTLDITLSKPQTFAITLTDAQGRVVYTLPSQAYTASKHSITIPMQQLPTGTYYYHIGNEKILASGQVVKQ